MKNVRNKANKKIVHQQKKKGRTPRKPWHNPDQANKPRHTTKSARHRANSTTNSSPETQKNSYTIPYITPIGKWFKTIKTQPNLRIPIPEFLANKDSN